MTFALACSARRERITTLMHAFVGIMRVLSRVQVGKYKHLNRQTFCFFGIHPVKLRLITTVIDDIVQEFCKPNNCTSLTDVKETRYMDFVALYVTYAR